MLLVGLTGGMASGKTTVAEMLRERGARIIDADRIARKLVEPGEEALDEIAAQFGREALLPDGTLNRAWLARRIFSNRAERERLNAILHPRIIAEENRQIEELARKAPDAIVVVDAALMIETGSYKRMDFLVVVTAEEQEQLRRLTQERGMQEEEALERLSSQMPLKEKVGFADFVVDNGGPLERTEEQVEGLFRKLEEARGKKVDKRERRV